MVSVVNRIGSFNSVVVPPGGGAARSGVGAGLGDPGAGGGEPRDVEALSAAVPVKVSFGVLIAPGVEAESLGLAAPVPVNVNFGVRIVAGVDALSLGPVATPVPVNVSFGVLIVPEAEAASRGLAAAPVPVNVSFGVLMVAPFVGAAGCSGLVGRPGFASGGLTAGVFIGGF